MKLVALVLVLAALWFAWNGYSDRTHAASIGATLSEQTAYLCSTVAALDPLVVAAIEQIETNFDNGTYARLRRQGIITKQNIRATRQLLQTYRASHVILSQTKPCQEVAG